MAVQTFETLIEREFMARAQKRIEYLSDLIAAGQLEDFSQYKFKCGQINGIRLAMDILAEAHDAAVQENR